MSSTYNLLGYHLGDTTDRMHINSHRTIMRKSTIFKTARFNLPTKCVSVQQFVIVCMFCITQETKGHFPVMGHHSVIFTYKHSR